MYALPTLTLSPTEVDEATGDITLSILAVSGDGKFSEGATAVVDGLEGYVPDPTVSTRRVLVVAVPNDTRVPGTYPVQVRFADGRITAPALLTIADVP